MPTYTTVCLDCFNEIGGPCISTCPSRLHLASHESVCDFLLRKWLVRQRCFEIECASVSHVAHAKVQSLWQEGTENSWRDVKCIEVYIIASNTLECKAVDFKDCTGDLDWKRELHIQVVRCSSIACEHLHTSVERHYPDLCHLHLQI